MISGDITSENRVPCHTSRGANERIRANAAANVAKWADTPQRVEQRLDQLDREWDVERALETGSSTLSLLGLALGYFLTPWFYLLTLAVQTFFLQHALQGWCPPLPVFRRLGFRTRDEIGQERFALKAIRGDFEGLGGGGTVAANRAFAAAGDPRTCE